MAAPKYYLPPILEQLAAVPPRSAARRQERPGAQRPHNGSITYRVLMLLRERSPRWHEHCELMRLTGASRGAIAWAVRYLQERGMARSIPSNRNPQYRRYQAVLPVAGNEPDRH